MVINMAQRVYIETTIPSYLTAWPSRDLIIAGHQQMTKEWWRTRRDEFELCISQFVIDEASAGDSQAAQERLAILSPLPLLDISEAVLKLASAIVESEIIPVKAARDAAHIAISAVHAIDFLLTWNCAHIANAQIVKKVQTICTKHGFPCPLICTPEELMGS
jgi:hypothetical protein